MSMHLAKWQRREAPVLSGLTTRQDWCRVELYNPTVVRVADRYMMWYIGNSSATRTDDTVLGLAESDDGIHWNEHPDNPILTGAHLPACDAWQTPHVIYDPDEGLFKMWFIMSTVVRGGPTWLVSFEQQLGYATSRDGVQWDVHPEPVYHSGRRPCVIKDGPGAYRMWMNSSPTPDGSFDDLVRHIYRFESTDGVEWTRDPEPAVSFNEKLRGTIYPFVMRDGDGYIMWYGGWPTNGEVVIDAGSDTPLVRPVFEIYCSTSVDGLNWIHHQDTPALPATRNPVDYDGRYTSTPCVVDGGDRYLMYYSARDWGTLFRTGSDTLGIDKAGIYRHIGVAVCPKT